VLAATASCIVRTPTAVIAQRMQIGQYATVSDAMHGVASGQGAGVAPASRGGLAAFYTGLGVSVARELPFAIVQFPLYEALKRLIVARRARGGGQDLLLTLTPP
jgi:solute carrier family 25 S-adenosylmethionine transporter 26